MFWISRTGGKFNISKKSSDVTSVESTAIISALPTICKSTDTHVELENSNLPPTECYQDDIYVRLDNGDILLAFGFALTFIFLATPVNADNPSASSFDDEGPPPWADAEVVRQPDSEVRRRLAGFYSYQDSSQTAVSEISVSKDSEFKNRPIIRIPTGVRANETLCSNAMTHRVNSSRPGLSDQLPGLKSFALWTLGVVGLFVILVIVVGLMATSLLEQNHHTSGRA